MNSRLTVTPPGVKLCALEMLDDPGSHGFVLQMGEQYFHGFIVRRGRQVFGYVDRCPHMGFPLAQKLDEYLSPSGDHIVCSWHHSIFRAQDGACIGGPCAGQRLSPWPVRLHNGNVETA
jgi:nitrite reductase/ring-hydroxylating ferredoxin subunit